MPAPTTAYPKRKRPQGGGPISRRTPPKPPSSWVKAKIEAPLLAAQSGRPAWAGVHALLASDGLTLTRRGAGLVIADAAAGHAVKASAVNRAFSLKELTARLGPFQPGLPAATAPGAATAARRSAAARPHIFTRTYVRQREAGLKARRAARGAAAEARRTVYAAYTADATRRSGDPA